MVETLIAVLILGLVVTASLKLLALSTGGLAQVRTKEIMLDEATAILIDITNEPTFSFGTSDDIEWTIEDLESPLWGNKSIDIDSMGFEDEMSKDLELIKEHEQKWKELEIQKGDQKLVFILPPDIEVISRDGVVDNRGKSADVASDDEK